MASFYSKIRDLIASVTPHDKNSKANQRPIQNNTISEHHLLSQAEDLINTNFNLKRSELGYESSPEQNKSSKKEAGFYKGYSSNPETSSKRHEPTKKSVVSLTPKSRRPSVHTRLDTDQIAVPMPETPLSAPDLSIEIIDSPKESKVGQASKGCSETEKAPIMPKESKTKLGKYTAKILTETTVNFTQNQR